MWDSVDCSFRAGEIDEQRCLAYFQAHDEQVRREVPADRLLEFDVSKGWAPLCDFLGVPVPEHNFPVINDGVATQNVTKALRMASVIFHIVICLLLVLIWSQARKEIKRCRRSSGDAKKSD